MPARAHSVSASSAAALLVPAALFAVNFVVHNLPAMAGNRLVYFGLVVICAGTILPSLALRWLELRHGIVAWRAPRGEPFRVIGALALGLALAAWALGPRLTSDPQHAVHVFAWVFMTSVIECLVFLGICFHVVKALVQARWGAWAGWPVATLASCAAFALYHFSYPPPWNTFEVALKVGRIWLEVVWVYALTRSFWAAVSFNNMLATIGFTLHGVTALNDEPLLLAIVLDLALIALGVRAWLATVRGPRLDRGMRAG
jgi:hypothetical protein